jgi:translocation and assembly module TamA
LRSYLLVLTLAASLFFPLSSSAASLEYTISGVDRSLRDNVRGWLGAPPETPEERLNFLVSARDRINSSLQALGYYRAEVTLDVDRSQSPWQMQVDVTPNEPVLLRHIRIEILGPAGEEEAFQALVSDTVLRAGEVLNHQAYDVFRAKLQNLGQRRGYFDGSITASRVQVDADGGTADVLLEYDSGTRYRFGQLDYDATQLDLDQLEILQPFRAGDPYDVASLQKFQSALQQTGYFSSVALRPRLAERADYKVPLSLELFPARRHKFDLGIGFSTDTEERMSVTWRTPKINRFGHRQETRIQYSPINPSGRFIYSIPLSHPLNDTLQLSLRIEENEYGDIDSQQQEVAARREIKEGGNWLYSYSLRGLNESWDVGDFRADNDYLLPGFSVSHKRRRGPLVNPEAGFSQYYTVEGASEKVGSDVDLLRVYADYVMVMSLAERQRLVARGELGAVYISDKDRDQLAPSLNFFAGGSQNIRGYSYQSLGNEVEVEQDDGTVRTFVVGGTRLVTASLEYQYLVNQNWRAAVFADAGDAFDEGDMDINYGVGFGVHYLTPVGAIKVEIANPVGSDTPDWRFHFNIGAEF